MADIQTKYQKLASEYSKLRSQVPVLKKAVIDEQGKGETLKESIKEKDQTIRKYEQEIDSLSFRNQQLSSRVGVLQEELDEAQRKGSKNKKGTPPGPAPSSFPANAGVIGEELQSKIEENARLHKQVYEADAEYQQTVMQLRDRLMVLETEASQHQQILNTTVTKNKGAIDKLQEEKAMLEVKLQKQEKDVKEAKTRASDAEMKLKTIEYELSTQLTEASKIIKDKLPFNDTKQRDLNALNIPTYDRKHQLQAKELVGQAAALIKELVQSLSNYHTYCEQRSRIYPADSDREPMSDTNKKLCQYLHENASYLRPTEQAFRTFHESLREDALTTVETAAGLRDFADKFKKYVAYVAKITPYHLLSLEEESSVSSCTATLESKNMELHRTLSKFTEQLTKLETYVSLIAMQSCATCPHPRSSHSRLFELLSRAVTDFHEVSKEISKHFNAKVSLEHQLPTATQKLKTTDECVVSSLVGLVTCTGKFSAFLAGNLTFFSQTAGYRTRGSSVSTNDSAQGPKSHPAVGDFMQQAAQYMSALSKPCPDTVPYKVAIQNRKILFSSTESRDSLAHQVANMQEKISKLEQDKEHWMLESQLLQIKHEKELEKVTQLTKQMQRLQGGSIEENLDVSATDDHKAHSAGKAAPIHIDTSMLGKLETATATSSDQQVREQLIKSHFANRITELNNQLQLAESKAVHFHAECRALHKRLKIAEKNKSKLEDELNTANQSIAQLKDELQTTTRSYEGQLSMMSEHLAGMNEKLTKQKDEIEELKYHLQNARSGKKGKK